MKLLSRAWRLVAGLVFTFGLITAGTGGSVLVASATQPPDHRVTICHATDADRNPYVVLTPDIASTGFLQGGHDGHTGPIWLLGDQGAHQKWGDIIPPYRYVRADGSIFAFPGLNWTTEGQAIWANGCAAPRPAISSATPAVTPTPGTTPTPGATPTPESSSNPTPTPTGVVLAATATPTGEVLAATGATTPGMGLGVLLIAFGLFAMTGGAIAWRRRTA